MNLIHTKDGTQYRRWVNVIPALLFPGSAQFLSGRRSWGVGLFAFYLLLVAGPIRRTAIIGKAVSIYAPADRKGRIE